MQENDRIPATNGDVTHLAVMDAYATMGMIVFGRNPVRHGSNPLAIRGTGNGGLELVVIPEINAHRPIKFGAPGNGHIGSIGSPQSRLERHHAVVAANWNLPEPSHGSGAVLPLAAGQSDVRFVSH